MSGWIALLHKLVRRAQALLESGIEGGATAAGHASCLVEADSLSAAILARGDVVSLRVLIEDLLESGSALASEA